MLSQYLQTVVTSLVWPSAVLSWGLRGSRQLPRAVTVAGLLPVISACHGMSQLLSSRRGQADPAPARVPKTASKAIGSTDSAGDPGLGAKLAARLEQRILFPGLHPTICKFQKAHLFPLCLLAGVWFFSLHYKAIVFSLYYKAE